MTAIRHKPRAFVLCALAAFLAGALVLAAPQQGDAVEVQTAKAKRATARVLGKTPRTPKPLCPKDCTVIATVSGFQTRAQGVRKPFEVRKRGTIVAWSVRLGKPSKDNRKFFEENFASRVFGKGPVARISVLKKVKKGKFRLVKQSPGVDLSAFYNEQPVITLTDPLRVRKGHIIALTVPSWLPNLVPPNRTSGSQWRASRPKGQCGPNRADDAKPQQKVGSKREYGCFFQDRILYWAYFVPNRR